MALRRFIYLCDFILARAVIFNFRSDRSLRAKPRVVSLCAYFYAAIPAVANTISTGKIIALT
ncbi:Hypothetical protein ETEE_3791 [Edwardsiella anguillarum ET080813]|uniref:Uncharacterized protein n=1 Tax=Edwardsiella anguillarum ET080813 TaxID=667120 RepID=A0A076LUR6_9GAMM|nr:Hypothetical protein ETEE_3791 [Edwardsiella anguillarum ET080813]